MTAAQTLYTFFRWQCTVTNPHLPTTSTSAPLPLPPTQGVPGAYQGYQGYPPQGYQPYPPPKQPAGTPGWMLVAGGALLAVGGLKAMEFMGGKKGDMQAMMMQQMMKQMAKQAGAGGAPGGMGGMPGMGGMGGMPGMPTPGANAGFPPFPTPTPIPPRPPTTAHSATVDVEAKPAAAVTAAPAAATSAPKTGAPGSGSFFADADASAAGPSTTTPLPNPFTNSAVDGEPVPEDDEAELAYMQEMLRNPQMQEMMYPYLPEMMRNPQTFEMLLTNPMYKDQLKGIMAQMKAGDGGDFTQGMPDVNSPEVQEQFAAMGMTPQDAIQKLMGDPELAAAFQNPKIQTAVMDCSSNPNNIMKYQNDPEIMAVFMKLATMFPGAGGAGAGMPDMGGMPPAQ